MITDVVTFAGKRLRAPTRANDPLDRVVPLARIHKSTTKGVTTRYWTAPLPDAAAVVTWADQNGISVDPQVRRYADNAWARELTAAARCRAATVLPADKPAITGLRSRLLAHQEVGIAAAAAAVIDDPAGTSRSRGILIGDDPGLGKTLMALCVLRLQGAPARRAVVICPTSLTANWVGEMRQHFVEGAFAPWIATSTTPTPPPPACDVVVIGWEILHAWADELVAWSPDVLICDEGHYGKSGKQQFTSRDVVARTDTGAVARDASGNAILTKETKATSGSARGTAVLALSAAVGARADGLVVNLTGTPIVNRPLELEPLLESVGILHLLGGSTAYRMRHCGPKRRSIGGGREALSFNGAENLLELNRKLTASGHYIRRTKQILVDSGEMPPKFVDGVYAYDYSTPHRPWIITATDEEMAEYLAVADETVEFFTARAHEFAASLRAPLDSPLVKRKVAAEGQRELARIAKLRLLAARIKLRPILAKVSSLVEQGEKVVIAAHHREIVDAYADAFTGLRIQGGMGTAKIEEAKALFNETPVSEHPVLVLSVEAGKTGHTLCKQSQHGAGPACALMVFGEQVWTPGDETQTQDRIWRLGQDRTVHISNALLSGTVDQDMYSARARKRGVVNAVLDAVDPTAFGSGDKGMGELALGFVGPWRASRQHVRPPSDRRDVRKAGVA